MKPIPWVFRFQAAAEPAGQGPCSAPGATDHAGAAGDVRWGGQGVVKFGLGVGFLCFQGAGFILLGEKRKLPPLVWQFSP